uniref:Ig-like domain-containing protein n=1 Tax=Oreochromis niloticus TaxID=8128 RepID=A0A669CV93_ORENI
MAGCSLTVNPSEIVVRFGDPVSVNCSTSARYVTGMGWEAPFGGTGFERPPVVTWRVDKLEEWTPSPFCYATLDDGSQCTLRPVITIFKTPDFVSISVLDHSLIMQDTEYNNSTRTQYWLQCNIINVAPVQFLTVNWYKNNESIMAMSFNDTTTKTPVNESSILKINISREENVAEFRCEAELDFGPHGPKLYVTVGNPPPVYNWTCDGKNMLENTNSLNITRVKHNATCCPLTLTPSETVVTFGDPVSVNCSTSATDVEGMGWEAPFGGTGFEPPPVVTWRVEKLEEWTPSPFCYATLVDGSQCTVSPVITVYKIPDTVSIYPMNQSQMMEKHVHYNKHTRTLRGLQCNIINVAPVQFLTVNWYKNNESIMAMSFNDTTTKTPVNESLILKVNISREENVAEFRCEAELDFGPHGPKLYIMDTFDVLHILHQITLKMNPSEIVVRFGDPVSVNCSTSARYVTGMGWEAPFGGTGFKPPPVVTWRVDKLEEWTPSPFCYATLADGSRCTSHPVIIVYKTPDFVSVPDMARGPMVEGIGYNLKCDIYNVAPVQNLIVKWYRGNETVLTQTFNGSALTPVNTSSTLRISTQRDYNGLTFRCEAALHLGPKGPKFPPNVTSPPYTAVVLCKISTNLLHVSLSTKLINPSKSLTRTDSGKYTASENESDTIFTDSPSFTCKEHYEVTVNDKPQSICEPVGLPTPTLTWFKDGKQMVSPQRWKKNDSGKYLLNAHNTHGTAEHTLYLEILCNADSNPPSNIRWIYTAAENSNVTTEGHQKIISITKATSTNGGYYICVAENKAGRNTRFVRLKEMQVAALLDVICAVQILYAISEVKQSSIFSC